MSEAPAATSLDLEQLKRDAEAQQRRRAPPLAGQQPKKRRMDDPDAADDEHDEEGPVSRFSYAADTEIAAGSTCFMASCGFNRQRSAAKEMLNIIKPLLPEGTQIQTVKVGCRGLAVVRVLPAGGADSAPIHVTDIVAKVLDQIKAGTLKHTKFCERIVPAETTCLLNSVALEAALTRVARAYLDKQQQQQQQQQQGGSGSGDNASDADNAAAKQQPIEFAVLYKSRGVDKQILAEMEREATAAKEQQQQQQQDQAELQQEGQQSSDQQPRAAQSQVDQQQQEQAAAPAAAAAAVAAADVNGAQVQGLDRQRVLDLAVAVMQQCTQDMGGAKVNLSKPQVVVMVEAIPLLKQQMACAVTMIPSSIMSSSHKLKIKPISAGESGKEAGSKQKPKQKPMQKPKQAS